MSHGTTTTRRAELALDPETFRSAGHELVDRIAEFLETLPDRPVAPGEEPATVRSLIGGDRPLPEDGTDAAGLIRQATELLFDHSLFNGHPRFFGYITSSPAPIGVLADLLAAAVGGGLLFAMLTGKSILPLNSGTLRR